MARGGLVALGALVGLTGCSSARPLQRASPAGAPSVGAAAAAAATTPARYVDEVLGFEISRPSAEWQLDETDERTPEGLVIPVILRNRATGAQVVLQVAPAVATPAQFAERLTDGLRTQPGFTTTDPEPLPLSDSAVGFHFTMGEAVHGKVAVLDGGEDRVFMMMATWPASAPAAVLASVDAIIGSVHALPADAVPALQVPAPPLALR
ncbi:MULTISPECIES: hypothetical protein [Myxococcaceae]|uniref:hypothetical protein n=1 Tax=Myxococcaceae TaxID=31 RepID=UPI00188DE25F|nr:hypothetical protein [Simulacricoccus sp. 17bor-14]